MAQDISNLKCVHFIGVGGVGMSSIALVAHARGMQVSGSDLRGSSYVEKLRAKGIAAYVGHAAENVPADCDAVVVSTAIPEKNPELAEARRRGLPVLHRAQMLAALGEGKKTLACAGTHGKTTTSSMLATMVDRMGLEPSFLIGGTVDGYNTNGRWGAGEYYVVEADESDGSFVELAPHVALVTNIEPDHMDHFADLDEIFEIFARFMALVPEDGAVVACAEDAEVLRLAAASGKRVVTYGEAALCPNADVQFVDGEGAAFTVVFPGGFSAQMALANNPGRHNKLNACGILAVAWALGLPADEAAAALNTFSGVRRRFDFVAEVGGVRIIDDYGHHPTELAATIQAARSLGQFKKIHVLFQPHRYTRTEALAREFGACFDAADHVTMMDVYSAGEAPIPGINGKTLVNEILAHNPRAQVSWMPHTPEVIPYLCSKLEPGTLLMTMGAGDITAIGPQLAEALGGAPNE